MRNHKRLKLEQLDRKLQPFSTLRDILIPERGWVYIIRTSMNMTLKQLGDRLGLSKQGVKMLEQREAAGSISIKRLKVIGQALDMKLVYGFVPMASSVDEMVDIKAKALAEKIVLRTNHNMKLEDQANTNEQIHKAIQDLADDIKREMKRSLWD